MRVELNSLLYQILQIADSGLTRSQFIRNISTLLTDFLNCSDIVQLLKVPDKQLQYELMKFSKRSFSYNILSYEELQKSQPVSNTDSSSGRNKIWLEILEDKFDSTLPFFSARGTFRASSDEILFLKEREGTTPVNPAFTSVLSDVKSLAIIPFLFGNERIGLIQIKNMKHDIFAEFGTDEVEEFAQTLGLIILNHYSKAALQERVKELTCLYSMSMISKQIDILLEDILYRIMELIPPAWQYPEITQSRIILDEFDYSLPEFVAGRNKLSADIVVNGKKRGVLEVVYTEKRDRMDEGPFLKEERKLIDTITNELSIIIKRRETEEEKINLQNQLHHADRLATVGELAAGVAHELNEPMGSIMGFAQLAIKCEELPEQAEKDLQKIVKSSLHAREIIKKLMAFSGATQSEKVITDINHLVEESIYFFKSRCHKEGILLTIFTDTELPLITVDPVQIEQVLTNIIVNAMHVMPQGGKLDIRTGHDDEHVKIIIRDTGSGMSREVSERIFDPFFTTKKAGKGIGLGLSVVKGIIDSHKGHITVASEPGKGTQFEISLPFTNK